MDNHPCGSDARWHLWPSLLATYSLITDRLEEDLQTEVGIPLSWFDVLVQLQMAPEGRLPMHQLADSVLLSKSGVTRLVDRMERHGLIERADCPTDRRVIYAAITQKGKSVFEKAAPVHIAGVKRHFSRHLTDAEVKSLGTCLSKIREATRSEAAQSKGA